MKLKFGILSPVIGGMLFLAGAANAQQKPAPKPFTLPAPKEQPKPLALPSEPELFTLILDRPLIAKDESCAKNLAKAAALEGIDQRKSLADLFVYGCVSPLLGMWEAIDVDSAKYEQDGHAVSMRLVDLKGTRELSERKKLGWVLASPELISRETIGEVFTSLPIQTRLKILNELK